MPAAPFTTSLITPVITIDESRRRIMTINITVPKDDLSLKPRITVIGVGGAGGNAVNNMIQSNLHGVDFIVANTDAQALELSHADQRIQQAKPSPRALARVPNPMSGAPPPKRRSAK